MRRRAEENGVAEASSPIHENVGFMAYNALAGGVLTGKYLDGPPTTYDNPNFAASMVTRLTPRGRHDDPSWGRTLYRSGYCYKHDFFSRILSPTVRPSFHDGYFILNNSIFTYNRYRSGPANKATIAYSAIAKKAKLSLTEMSLLWCRERRLPTTVLVGIHTPATNNVLTSRYNKTDFNIYLLRTISSRSHFYEAAG